MIRASAPELVTAGKYHYSILEHGSIITQSVTPPATFQCQVSQMRSQMDWLELLTETRLHLQLQHPNPALLDHHVDRAPEPAAAIALDEAAPGTIRQGRAGLDVKLVVRVGEWRGGWPVSARVLACCVGSQSVR